MRTLPLVLALCLSTFAHAERLYNNIELPTPWPPADSPPTREPMKPPYLGHPERINNQAIRIDIGRQLFVDDFLIEKTDLKRTWHHAEYYPQNPVVKPDVPSDQIGDSQGHPAPTAMVFSDGVWFDPQDNLFKMWYMAGYAKATAYAESKDGITWTKPQLDVVPGTNIVSPLTRDSATVWLDLEEKDPQRRYKMFLYQSPEEKEKYSIFFSADGKHWSDRAATSGPTGDRSTVFYNPFRHKWVYNIRDYDPKTIGRFRRYHEADDVLEAAKWSKGEPTYWVGADTGDAQREDLKTPCELYNLDCVAYESVMLGLFSVWRGQPKDRAKPNEICVGFSRDGFYWQRPDHAPFIPVSEHYGDWNWGNVQSAGGCCLVVNDKLYFYVSGRAGVQGSPASGVSSTGLATLRRDGFASMDAEGTEGTLVTTPVQFKGKYLFINADASQGEIRVAVSPPLLVFGAPYIAENRDGSMAAAKGYETLSCNPMRSDSTRARITWKDHAELSVPDDALIVFQFTVKNARLYSFWVSDDESGASNGYVAAGGPGFTGPADTVGGTK